MYLQETQFKLNNAGGWKQTWYGTNKNHEGNLP